MKRESIKFATFFLLASLIISSCHKTPPVTTIKVPPICREFLNRKIKAKFIIDKDTLAFDGKLLDLYLIDAHYCVEWLVMNGQ